MRGAASESAAAPVSHNAADPVKINSVCDTKLNLPYQTDTDAAHLSHLIYQSGSTHEWSGDWNRPKPPVNVTGALSSPKAQKGLLSAPAPLCMAKN